ncbi:hypothetical protein B0T24DRAFT_635546 [Lasiosphaeria ovina]|uniref:Uncharacterized protein n=1 Tax=Lasiosphaeria ovina TaxID=92902 RepID=A0AAE0K0E6_9PEZI|nr:hypothetical protein B0T24DRAFT_635546 [Lasiosphaeria ovina]
MSSFVLPMSLILPGLSRRQSCLRSTYSDLAMTRFRACLLLMRVAFSFIFLFLFLFFYPTTNRGPLVGLEEPIVQTMLRIATPFLDPPRMHRNQQSKYTANSEYWPVHCMYAVLHRFVSQISQQTVTWGLRAWPAIYNGQGLRRHPWTLKEQTQQACTDCCQQRGWLWPMHHLPKGGTLRGLKVPRISEQTREVVRRQDVGIYRYPSVCLSPYMIN